MFKVGQKVWCAIYGAGVVAEIQHASEGVYPVEVEFNNGHSGIYTNDGKYYSVGNITLFPYPVEIVKAIIKPSIDWDHVSHEYNYLAQDASGAGFLCGKEPHRMNTTWGYGDSLHPCQHVYVLRARNLRLERLPHQTS